MVNKSIIQDGGINIHRPQHNFAFKYFKVVATCRHHLLPFVGDPALFRGPGSLGCSLLLTNLGFSDAVVFGLIFLYCVFSPWQASVVLSGLHGCAFLLATDVPRPARHHNSTLFRFNRLGWNPSKHRGVGPCGHRRKCDGCDSYSARVYPHTHRTRVKCACSKPAHFLLACANLIGNLG